MVAEYSVKAGTTKKVSSHTFRHTFISDFIKIY